MDTHYALQTGEGGADRLALLERAYGPDCRRILEQRGAGPGLRVADLGCGTGSTALWFAERVGPGGAVHAVDLSPDQIAVAGRRAAKRGFCHLHLTCAPADATTLPRASFDIVHCRFLLCHLLEPIAVLREMTALAKPGGLVIAFEPDLQTLRSLPSTLAYEQQRAQSLASGRARGHDYEIGRKLAILFDGIGLAEPDLAIIHPVYLRGEEKRFWEYTAREAWPSTERFGIATRPELEAMGASLAAVAANPTCAVALPALIACWARTAG